MISEETRNNPRIIVVQKLYTHFVSKDSEIIFPKHRYKKFIKDVVNGTIERTEIIEKLLDNELKDNINKNKTELLVKIMIMAAIFEFMYMHKTPIKVIINEYLKVSDSFIEDSQKNFLNAILDKASKISRLSNE